MRTVMKSVRRRPVLWMLLTAAFMLFGIVWVRHALALRHWKDRHGRYQQSVKERIEEILHPNIRIRINSQISQCPSNLRCWLAVLHSYHRSEGTLPPQVWSPDKRVDLRQSWRIRLLPGFEIPFASRYRDIEPWNGAHNEQFLDAYLDHAHCPQEEHTNGAGLTNYVAVVGPNCMWREERGVSFDEVTDDPAQTILLVEWPQSDIHFLEPRDLSVDQFLAIWSDPDTEWPHETQPPFLQTRATLYMNVGMVDGSVKRLPADTPPETLKALLTIDGGETIVDPFLP